MAAKKKDAEAEAEAVVEEKPAAKKAVAKEPAVEEGTVRAVNNGGVAMLAFGDVVVNEEEPSEFVVSSYHALTTDDALGLAADLPTVVQEASAMATHTG